MCKRFKCHVFISKRSFIKTTCKIANCNFPQIYLLKLVVIKLVVEVVEMLKMLFKIYSLYYTEKIKYTRIP